MLYEKNHAVSCAFTLRIYMYIVQGLFELAEFHSFGHSWQEHMVLENQEISCGFNMFIIHLGLKSCSKPCDVLTRVVLRQD